MSSHELLSQIGVDDRRVLLEVAKASIEHGLLNACSLEVVLDEYPRTLHEIRASFVTLRIGGALRGCMGALKAVDALVVDVARNAYSAAFRDPRFDKLSSDEFPRLEISISVLGPSEPIEVDSETELLATIRPGVDGLTVYDGERRGTLLPAVWENIPEPQEFIAALKRKAGLSEKHWSDSIRFERYTAASIKH